MASVPPKRHQRAPAVVDSDVRAEAEAYSITLTCTTPHMSPVPWKVESVESAELQESAAPLHSSWRFEASMLPSFLRSRSTVAVSPGLPSAALNRALQPVLLFAALTPPTPALLDRQAV